MIEEESIPELDQEEELFEHHRFKADKGQDITRIDKFLLDRLPNTSRNKIQVAAKNGNIHVGGKAVKQNYKVKPGDEISIVMPYPVREITLLLRIFQLKFNTKMTNFWSSIKKRIWWFIQVTGITKTHW